MQETTVKLPQMYKMSNTGIDFGARSCKPDYSDKHKTRPTYQKTKMCANLIGAFGSKFVL